MTEAEKTTIVNEVLSAIRTNSVTIDQLTPVTTLGDNDWFEVNDGRKVQYSVLRNLISSLFTEDQNSLRTLISKNELSSVSFSTTESAVSISIKSVGKTITASVPIATNGSAGLITAADKVKITTAYDTAIEARDKANDALSKTAGGTVRGQTAFTGGMSTSKLDMYGEIDMGQNVITNLNVPQHGDEAATKFYVDSNDQQLSDRIDDIEDLKGEPCGYAELDDDGYLYDEQTNPAYKKAAILFDGIVSNVGLADISLTSTPAQIVFDEQKGRLLAVGNAFSTEEEYHTNWPNAREYGTSTANGIRPYTDKLLVNRATKSIYIFNGTSLVLVGKDYDERVENLEATKYTYHLQAIIGEGYADGNDREIDALYYDTDSQEFFIQRHGRPRPGAVPGYYKEIVADEDMCLTALFICGTKLYKYDDGVMVEIGVTDKELAHLLFVNYDELVINDGSVNAGTAMVNTTFANVLSVLSGTAYAKYRKSGVVVTFTNEDDEWETWQWKNGGQFADTENWEPFGGGAAVGNCYNVTAARAANGDSLPTSPATYDTKQSAIEYAISKKCVGIGVQITFASSATTWKTYQYIGLSAEPEAFANLENWIDVAGQSAGDEQVVNINYICKDISIATTYNLTEAIAALTALREQKNVDYVKAGMVITYKTGDGEWETKQLIGSAADYTNPDAWHDFGGGGNDLEANDNPEAGGTDAFSTGGAYRRLITDFESSTSEDGTMKTYYAKNAAGETIGNPIEIPISQGGGAVNVRNFAVRFENNPLYASAGGEIKARMAARSYSQDGEETIVNKITGITILDGTTGIVLSSRTLVGELSSSSLTDYRFELDFTSFFNGTGSRDFTVRVTDEEGAVRTAPITVIAVDVTVEITRQLNECRVNAGSGTVTLDNFYRFEKNTLGKSGGIDAVIELLWNGEWRELGRNEGITSTFATGITLNPSNLFGGGERMTHGAYLMRIHGYAPSAKVTGNYVYSSIMCIDSSQASVPVVAIRYDAKVYDESLNGEVNLYDNAVLMVAAYTGASVSGNTTVSVYANDDVISTQNMAASQVYRINYQVQGFRQGESIEFKAVGTYGVQRGTSPTVNVVVAGSAIDVVMKDGAVFGYDFALRTNADADKTITDNGVTMQVNGSNWSSNGFGTYCGERCLRIAENVTATIPYRPFSLSNAESSGLALQFAFATNNIKDADAMLMHCYDPTMGVGFYVKGNVVGIYCNKGQGKNKTEERKFRCGEKITMAVVVEPSSIYHERVTNGSAVRYSNIKLYLNGEEVACLAYVPGQSAIAQSQPIQFNGCDGDFYLFYFMAYQSHYEWAQAFNNYLAKLTDVSAMIEEFENENVLNDLGTPSLDKMKAKGMPYYVVVAAQSVFDEFDSDVNTSTKFNCTLYYFNPEYPCLNFKATNVQWRRQGTTSAKRPVKNDRFYLNKPVDKKKPTVFTLLNPDNTTELGRKAIALAALNYTLVRPDAIPVQIITVKVDYSDSSNANDCGVCDIMNATYRALGPMYQTPAQRAFDGTFTKGDVTITGCVMDHSTKNHPIAAFRATDDTLTDAWFQAKGNWKEDKAEQVALGFQKTPGYNLGCKNYGDFVEYFGTEGETIAQIEARFRAEYAVYAQYQESIEGLGDDDEKPEPPAGMVKFDNTKLYILSLYCGRDYRFLKYVNGDWAVQRGSMKQVNGHWQVTGTVLNPVTGFELLAYQGFDWWQGVSSVADMMDMQAGMSSWVQKLKNAGNISTSTFPAWTQYFECMIDDDQLQIDLALGKKVPYDLYRMLKFCNDCNMVQPVAGAENRFEKVRDDAKIANWRNNLWRYASPHSVMSYTAFTDYMAATDQRAKNMQPMWFLEDGYSVTDGVYSSDDALRMYLNKVYDCDTCNGKDNDGGCTVDAENDPNKFTDDTYTNPYSGYGSTLFANIDICEMVYLDGTHSTDNQLSLKTVVAAMRTAKTTVDGVEVVPFSPEGAMHFFVEKRLKFWKKLISSYDGEHKYIEFTGSADALYFYALQGLGLTALPQFIEQRWRFRDGYYQTGDFFSGVLSGRIACSSSSAKIKFRAAKTGYFGIGHDASGNLDEAVFLEAGQEWEFTQFSHQESALLYIYQADRMSEIDLSEISLDGTFNFGVMSLVEKLVIGSATHHDINIGSYTALSTVMLGNLPFLRELDLRNTTATGVDASGCPRIESILAEGSQLTSCTLAQTSPITTLHLPATMTELSFINIPNLTYPGGLELAGMSNVQKLMVSGCPKMDAMSLIDGLLQSSNLRAIGLRDVNITASVDILRSLRATQAYGLDENGNDIATDKGEDGHGIKCSGLTGRWILKELIEESELNALRAYFPALGENLYNSQFQVIKLQDDVDDPANKMTNLDNMTGRDYNTPYVQSGHLLKIEQDTHAYKCKYNESLDRLEGVQLSDADFNYLADGSTFDPTDYVGEGYDIFWHMAHCWYKGVNDYKNQCKYYIWSSCDNEPLSTASRISRKVLSEILYAEYSGIYVNNAVVGAQLGSGVIATSSTCSVYRMDVEGMKQVRWPGMNDGTIGCVFTDADNKIVSKFKMAVGNALFDFTTGQYIFTDVPQGAKYFYFTSYTGCENDEAIAVDSDSIEAIEPDWVEHKAAKEMNVECDADSLIGVYPVTVDALKRARSVSSNGASVRGTGTSTTNPQWTYDDAGNPTNTPTSDLNYTMKDFQNLCRRRYPGAQSIDYEQHKETAIMWWCSRGNLNEQSVVGNGQHAGRLNQLDSIGMADSVYNGNNFNSLMGLKAFVGCNNDWMDNIAVNVTSFAEFMRRRGIEYADFPIDAKAHIYDPITQTERILQLPVGSANNVARLIHGRFCDVLPSRLESDTSRYITNFCAGYWYTASRSRAVLRSSYSACAYSGFAYAYANSASSYSNTNNGARLKFLVKSLTLARHAMA